MASGVHGSEDALADEACKRLGGCPTPRLLIGGLGMGYTLAAALRHLGVGALVEVAEVVPAVVAWNCGPLAHLAGHRLEDQRVRVIEIPVAPSAVFFSSKPYKMLNGQAVASNWADLTDDAISASWEINEYGSKIPFDPGGGVSGCSWAGGMFFFPWTGSANSGQPSGATCSNWSSTGGTGRVGLGGYSLSQWTNWCDFPCTRLSHLYCLEQ